MRGLGGMSLKKTPDRLVLDLDSKPGVVWGPHVWKASVLHSFIRVGYSNCKVSCSKELGTFVVI